MIRHSQISVHFSKHSNHLTIIPILCLNDFRRDEDTILSLVLVCTIFDILLVMPVREHQFEFREQSNIR